MVGTNLGNDLHGGDGEANTISMVGALGVDIFKQKSGVDFELRKINATGSLSVSIVGDSITVDGAAVGETNTGSQLGTGSNVFKQKTGVDFEFRSLLYSADTDEDALMTLTENANDITFSLNHMFANDVGATDESRTFFGVGAGNPGTGGFNHATAFGNNALSSINGGAEVTDFSGCVAIGDDTLKDLTDGDSVTAVGSKAGIGQTTASNSSWFGAFCGQNINGENNTAGGFSSMSAASVVASEHNTAWGANTLSAIAGGDDNGAFGSGAGIAITTGNRNNLFGKNTGDNLVDGDDNLMIGHDLSAPASDTSDYGSFGDVMFMNLSNGATRFGGSGTVGGSADSVTIQIGSGSGATPPTNAQDFVIDSDDAAGGTGMAMLAPATGAMNIFFGDSTDATRGRLKFDNNDGSMHLHSGTGTRAIHIDSSQRVHLGGASASTPLHVSKTSGANYRGSIRSESNGLQYGFSVMNTSGSYANEFTVSAQGFVSGDPVNADFVGGMYTQSIGGGGLAVLGASDDAATDALQLYGNKAVESLSAPAISFAGAKENGSGAAAKVSGDNLLHQFNNSTTQVMTTTGDGHLVIGPTQPSTLTYDVNRLTVIATTGDGNPVISLEATGGSGAYIPIFVGDRAPLTTSSPGAIYIRADGTNSNIYQIRTASDSNTWTAI